MILRINNYSVASNTNANTRKDMFRNLPLVAHIKKRFAASGSASDVHKNDKKYMKHICGYQQ
jgi:hypothetical protein